MVGTVIDITMTWQETLASGRAKASVPIVVVVTLMTIVSALRTVLVVVGSVGVDAISADL